MRIRVITSVVLLLAYLTGAVINEAEAAQEEWRVEDMVPGEWQEVGILVVPASGTTYRIYEDGPISESLEGFCDQLWGRLERRGALWVRYYEGRLRDLGATYRNEATPDEWRLSAKLQEKTGNAYQGAECAFRLIIRRSAGPPSAPLGGGIPQRRVYLPIVLRGAAP